MADSGNQRKCQVWSLALTAAQQREYLLKPSLDEIGHKQVGVVPEGGDDAAGTVTPGATPASQCDYHKIDGSSGFLVGSRPI